MNTIIIKFNEWRRKRITNYQFLIALSLLVGLLSGIGAVLIKNGVLLIKRLITELSPDDVIEYLYFVFPAIGIFLAVFFADKILRHKVGHGIPSVLYAISKNNAFIKAHNMFSSIITSSLTVGFGGSVGLEGPTVATGGAIGANIGKLFNLTYKERVLLLGAAAASAMSAIFKSPIAGVVFALEVIMIDLTTKSVIPILFSSVTGSLTSYFVWGQTVLYPFSLQNEFTLGEVPYYIFLGIFTGLLAVYFTKTYVFTERIFKNVKKKRYKFLIGASLLGMLIYFFPALYGEGFESINSCLKGDYTYLYDNNFIAGFEENIFALILLFLTITLLKPVAASLTFSAGGVGGIFAPSLFIGANAGLFFATIANHFKLTTIAPNNSALVGMAGVIAGVLHAPLTGIFLIGEITHGYGLFMPLMITAGISYVTVKVFLPTNVYSIQLAKKGELITHHADHNVLIHMQITDIIETDFKPVKPHFTLRQLVGVVAESNRNIFPVLDSKSNFVGYVSLDRIRKIMFTTHLYDKLKVSELMSFPEISVQVTENMDSVAGKIQQAEVFNLVVLDGKKYVGFISRANVFSKYRSLLKEFSEN